MPRPRILITVTNNTFTDQRMQRIASSLSNGGYEVAFIGHDRPPFFNSSDNNNKVTLLKTVFNKGPLFYAEYNVRLFLILLIKRFDIVYSVDLDTLCAARYASFLKRKKIVFDAHEYYTETPELENRFLVKAVWRLIKKVSLWKIDKAFTVNKQLAEILTNEDTISYQVIRNLPFYTFIEKIEKRNHNSLIYQGAINKGRGIELCISAMDLLPKHHLLIVGSGDLETKINGLIESSQSKNRITFFGPLSPEELRKTTLTAGIGLNLLEGSSKSYYYSLANKFFDYMQAGIPSINMAFPVYNYYLNKYKIGEAIESLDVNQLCKKVKFISDPTNYNTYYPDIKESSKILNWQQEEKILLDHFKELV